jgi:hypothetical protein
MQQQRKTLRLSLTAAAIVFASAPALALEINNDTGYELEVSVECAGKKDRFRVGSDQVGDCPGNVCHVGVTCKYHIKAKDDGSCKGEINGGSGLQVDGSDDGLSCIPYGG